MPLKDLLNRQFSVATRPNRNPLIAAAGLAAAQLLANNPNRLAFTLINLSANAMYINLDNAVTATNGIYVGPNGGSISMVWNEDFDMVGWEWWVIAAGAASSLLVVEILEEYTPGVTH